MSLAERLLHTESGRSDVSNDSLLAKPIFFLSKP